MKSLIKKFNQFINESSDQADRDELKSFGLALDWYDDQPLELDSGTDELVIKTPKGTITINPDHQTVGDLLAELRAALAELKTLESGLKIRVFDDSGSSDTGVEFEWSLPNGEQVFSPDLGMSQTVGDAVQELERFFDQIEAALEELDEDDRYETVHVRIG